MWVSFQAVVGVRSFVESLSNQSDAWPKGKEKQVTTLQLTPATMASDLGLSRLEPISVKWPTLRTADLQMKNQGFPTPKACLARLLLLDLLHLCRRFMLVVVKQVAVRGMRPIQILIPC